MASAITVAEAAMPSELTSTLRKVGSKARVKLSSVNSYSTPPKRPRSKTV